jgi:hypothetical protein
MGTTLKEEMGPKMETLTKTIYELLNPSKKEI